MFDPNLRGLVSFREAYLELEKWFVGNFYDLLIERIKTVSSSD